VAVTENENVKLALMFSLEFFSRSSNAILAGQIRMFFTIGISKRAFSHF
jgi:hypothetical protein